MNKLLRFVRSDDGPTAVEYAVMLALIVVVCLASINLLGQRTASSFSATANAITSGS